MFFEHEGRIYEAYLSSCRQAVDVIDVSGYVSKFITEVPFDFKNPTEWEEVAKAALTTHNAIQRARNARPVELKVEKI